MSRLLFAAARGARIETWYPSKKWQIVWAVRTVDDFYDYRIHPDDAHLQYGPISTALREMAEDPKYNSSWEYYLACKAADEFTLYFDSRQGKPDYQLFYLILAEALADEGM